MRYTLAFDAQCAYCRGFARIAALLDSRRRVEFVSLERASASGLLEAVPEQARFRSYHLVREDGRFVSGADGVPSLLSLLEFGGITSRAAGVRPVRAALALIYGTFVRRHDATCRAR